ncbi:alanyl-tRNA editing protein [Achromobacter ruhlandii]|uniref:alanyl-tRNA editing protein n=1 Tax=Achromobacter ruhlandii TaxID=72557 RepID=UPI0006BFF16B|nr:alanyl-tRNA editing protein [Achromobacter ruhlandii]AMG45212.1 alanyl-tRNA editing protein [Achromobacter xylosoxidans]CUI83791.1 Alanine--tRNA ligase [Achromobacter ruhlandii]CUJ18295.1 Alanine--tRNA ligase [Achromobacter ruhlandii]CUK02936.1 Alanine--tRNA ligase [Achromobacter ruhlandii]
MSVTLKRFDDAPYEQQCEATVIAVGADGVELDQTLCYARSGGQAGDSGTLTLADGRALPVADTIYADDRRRILHVLAEGAAAPQVGDRVTVRIDWPRRHRLMRLHTCLHLLGSLVPAPVTGCSISPDSARIDFDLPESTLDKADLTERLNTLIQARTDVTVNTITPEELAAQPDLVRTVGAAPPGGAARIRIIEIPGVDRQPCGGTHVANTGEIGAVTVTKIEKKSRTNRRVVVAFA